MFQSFDRLKELKANLDETFKENINDEFFLKNETVQLKVSFYIKKWIKLFSKNFKKVYIQLIVVRKYFQVLNSQFKY